jgi:hypothetical protein
MRGDHDEEDRLIQQKILRNTARDGKVVIIITVLTALFLPGTFMAVSLSFQLLLRRIHNKFIDSSNDANVQLG